jgi:hypothetical protein
VKLLSIRAIKKTTKLLIERQTNIDIYNKNITYCIVIYC